jgi:hypothetical protein
VKTFAAILFAWLLVWSGGIAPAASAASDCGDKVAMTCAGCCCCPREVSAPENPLAPVPARPANPAQSMLLLLPTLANDVVLDRAEILSSDLMPERRASAEAIPLFRRDCVLLI